MAISLCREPLLGWGILSFGSRTILIDVRAEAELRSASVECEGPSSAARMPAPKIAYDSLFGYS